LGIKSIVLGD